ncbi:MAG TPA: SDR family oxidoreductase, partial [Tepidiformaceae bacterium]|nr:SDR family oxidoreductase [Tepidiformaceae bacterium]
TEHQGDFHIPGSLDETLAEIRALGGEAIAVTADLGADDPTLGEQLPNLVAKAVEAFGGVDILVNNAAIAVPGTIESMKLRHMDLSWRINVWAPLLLCREVLPHLRAKGGGSIINISSAASIGPGPGPYRDASAGGTPYGLTKAALERFTQGLASELVGTGISVNALSPSRQIFVGGTIYVAKTNPAFSVSDLTGKRKDGTIMGDAAVAIISADHGTVTGRIYSDEGALTELRGVTTFEAYATF